MIWVLTVVIIAFTPAGPKVHGVLGLHTTEEDCKAEAKEYEERLKANTDIVARVECRQVLQPQRGGNS